MTTTTGSDYALSILRAAELTPLEIQELLGRLTVLAPSSLVEGVRQVKALRS